MKMNSLVEQYHYLFESEAVVRLTGMEFEKRENTTLKEQINRFYNSFGNKSQSAFGEITLDNRSFKDDSAHGLSRAKIAAFKALPEILNSGIPILPLKEHKGNIRSGMIAAPIIIAEQEYVAVAVIRQNKENNNRLYVHEVTLKEKLLLLKQKNLNDSSNPVLRNTTANHQGDIAKVLNNIVSAKNNQLIHSEQEKNR
jgi:hypothetical protein